jgi:hypothetical protein
MAKRRSLRVKGEGSILKRGSIFGGETRRPPKTLVVWLVAVGLERVVR